MGLCFSYQQTKDFEVRLSSLFALLVPRDDDYEYDDDHDHDDYTVDEGDGNGSDTMGDCGSDEVQGGADRQLGDVRTSSPSCDDPTPPLAPGTPEPTPPRERKKKHNTPKMYESKAVQVDLGFTEAPTPTSPPSPPPRSHTPTPAAPPTPTTSTSLATTTTTTPTNDALAQEERRRRRDERRAARNAHNDDKLKLLELTLKSTAEYLEERCKLDVHIFKGFDAGKKCLVLDIDYTIFDHKSDFDLAPEYKRPYLHEFLKTCSNHYNIIIWSATAFYHVHTKLDKLQLLEHPDFQICGALCKDHMIPYTFSVKRKTFVQDIKPLALLWRKFPDYFDHCNTIHIDDVAENFALNPRNGLRIDPFREALVHRQTDKELFYLTLYLTMISSLPTLSSLDHSKWKDHVINTLWGMQTSFVLPSFTSPEPASALLLQQHEQAMILKHALKEKMKEREREERAKEKEREERGGRVEHNNPAHGPTKANDGSNSSRGFGNIVTEVMTSAAMEVVAEVVTEEITKGVVEATMEESSNTTWTNSEREGQVEADQNWAGVEPTTEEEEQDVEQPLDVQILLTTALVDHSHMDESNYEEQANKERVDWENGRDWSREDLEVQHMKEMNAQAVF